VRCSVGCGVAVITLTSSGASKWCHAPCGTIATIPALSRSYVLLQVLDDGRLTDGQGRTVDFRNTLIVLTSNLGSEALASLPEGAEASAARSAVMAALHDAFRPEFLNRLDEILLFRRLSRDDMKGIVTIQLERLRKLLADRKITLEVDAAASVWLANAGYDPVYGARPLKRVISSSNRNSARARVSSVLPTPVGPRNRNEPNGRFQAAKIGHPQRRSNGKTRRFLFRRIRQ
jgi:hypothetical protein